VVYPTEPVLMEQTRQSRLLWELVNLYRQNMRKLLDNYYLVILRLFDYMYGKDMLFYRATGVVILFPMFNLFSIVFFIAIQISIDYFMNYIWEFTFIVIIIGIVNSYILDRIYNSKRRESLREQYKDESEEDRRRRLVWVVLYMVFSVVFIIFVFWMFTKAVK
jgi:formate hydrogenlyase subunit 3/multisubunit Na+/H+ antiporter MnhD subunit